LISELAAARDPIALEVVPRRADTGPAAVTTSGAHRTAAPFFLVRWLGRSIRLTFGLFLVMLSSLSMLPPSLFPVSSRGVVNARVSLIRAPIPGEVAEVSRDVGQFVRSGEVLCVVRNDRVPQMQDLEEIKASLAKLRTEERSVEMEHAAKSAKLKEYQATLTGYQNRVRERIQLELSDAKKILQTKKEMARIARSELERQRSLKDKELLQWSAWAELQKADATAQEGLLSEQSRIAQLENKLNNISHGYMIDVESEYSRYLQLITTLQVDVDELTIKLKQLEGYQEDLQEQLDRTTAFISRSSRQEVKSSTNCRILKREATQGQFVPEGGELFRFAHEKNLHIEAVFDNRYNGSISVGDAARVYLLGERRQIDATVSAVQVVDRNQRHEQFAYNVDPRGEEFTILLKLGGADASLDLLGQIVKVLIVPRNATPLHHLSAWLSLKL
jgi:multidrug resistance efflux pump